jgi:hypothetical protein
MAIDSPEIDGAARPAAQAEHVHACAVADARGQVDYTLGCEIRTKLVVSLYGIPRLQS